jgi:hypothetical protein
LTKLDFLTLEEPNSSKKMTLLAASSYAAFVGSRKEWESLMPKRRKMHNKRGLVVKRVSMMMMNKWLEIVILFKESLSFILNALMS